MTGTAHIDMDLFVYQVASACDGKWYDYRGQRYDSKTELNRQLKKDGIDQMDTSAYDTGRTPEDWADVKKSLMSMVEGLLQVLDCPYQGYISGKGNFRYSVATIQPYKDNRSTVDKPFHYDACRQFLVDNYGAIISEGEEADDAIGQAHDPSKDIIATLDKDLDCIPGKHYNWQKDQWYDVSEVEAMRNFHCQLLTGDTTDNIPGLFGVGPASAYVKAVKQMEDELEMIEYVYKEYERRFGSYAMMFILENAQLLWIRQRKLPLILQ